MNIINNYYGQNFQARIKIKPVNAQLIKNGVLGSVATSAGLASISAGVDSARLVMDESPSVYNSVLSPEASEYTKELLFNQAPKGIPVQSTAVPSASLYSGYKSLIKGAEYWNKEVPDDKVIPD